MLFKTTQETNHETPIPRTISDHRCHKTSKKHLTQAQLGEQTVIHRTMIGRIERGDYMPTILQLEKLAEVLEFRPEELW